MEHNTDRILWTVLILAIGVALFVTFKPAANGLLNQTTEKIQTVVTNIHGDTSDSSSSNTTIRPNLLINSSSSATNGYTTMPEAGAPMDILGTYSRTDSYEQVTANSLAEFYYRFVPPFTNSLHGLTPGETYTLSGSASHTAGELDFRAEYRTSAGDKYYYPLGGGSGVSNLGIPVSDGSVFKPFSYTFTVPANATDVYFSLENYNYKIGGFFRFKNMKLEKGSNATPYTP